MLKPLKKLSVIPVIILFTAAGIIAGSFFLHVQERMFATYRSNSYLMTTIPTGDFIRIFRGLSSPDDGERIVSYYSAGQMKIIDSGFIVKRIDDEKNTAAQRVLVYILKDISRKDYFLVLEKHPELKPVSGKVVRNPNDLL
jgi:hypothetical protein